MKTTKPMLEYLASCSKTSLESFELARLNDRANLRKRIIELMDELVEVDVQARVAEWIRVHRRRQTAMRRRSQGNPPPELKNFSLPLLPPNLDVDNDTLNLPALEPKSPISTLRTSVIEALSPASRNATSIMEKSRRIA